MKRFSFILGRVNTDLQSRQRGVSFFLTSPFVALNASKEYSKIGIPILGLLLAT